MQYTLYRIAKTLSLVLLCSIGLIACNGDQDTKRLQITGSSTIAPLLLELAQQYETNHPDVRIDVQTGGSARGIADSRQGLADIGMVSRALKPSESDLTPHPIARDGIAIILHKDNSLSELSRQQIIDIYTGKIKNWRQLSGKDETIAVVSKADGRSTLELFLSYFNLNSSDIQAHAIIGDNEHAIKTVLANKAAIAYVSIGTAEYNASTGVAIKLLANDGIVASTENVANGSFPLARSLNLVTRGEPSTLAQSFIDFSQSPQAHSAIKRQYFVPL
ncbi:phosphate ABC transporter substrate-binding protein [Pseudoteredinibacter isoporae]|uniref:phosphate ABC transporter substrate-binding protein n=1 Tax=Pseudoteredinibacter isoporae TaxID=570281 RepID=UPI00310B1F18